MTLNILINLPVIEMIINYTTSYVINYDLKDHFEILELFNVWDYVKSMLKNFKTTLEICTQL